MIFFTNVKINQAHMAFIGRWSPFHQGHVMMIKKKLKQNPKTPILILVRDTKGEQYSTLFRAEVVKLWMLKNNVKGTIAIIPDIEGIYWGRKVGYKTELVEVEEKIKRISGSRIRKEINNGGKAWKKLIARGDLTYLLTDATAKINERGLVVWLTGCPCSGKTTIANGLAKKIKLHYPHLKVQQMDGDVIRGTPIAKGVGFSPEDRALHIRRMGQLAKILADLGTLVICAFVSPERKIREGIKRKIGASRFVEVYVKASLETRIKRDKKGIYAKAKKGEILNLTGYNAPYDIPKKPNLICNTNRDFAVETIDKLFNYIFLKKRKDG